MRGIPSYTVTEKSGHFCLICKFFLMFFQIWVYRYVTLCGRGGACPSRGRPHGAAPTSIIFYDTIRILCVGAASRGRPRSDEGVAPYGKGKPPLNSNLPPKSLKRPKTPQSGSRSFLSVQKINDQRSAIRVSDRSSPSCGKRPARHRPPPAYPAEDP